MQGAGDPDALGYPADPAVTLLEKKRLSIANNTMREITQQQSGWKYLNPFSALWGIWKGRDLLNQLVRRYCPNLVKMNGLVGAALANSIFKRSKRCTVNP